MCIRDVVRWKANHCIIDARQYLQLRKLSLLLLLMLRKNRCISNYILSTSDLGRISQQKTICISCSTIMIHERNKSWPLFISRNWLAQPISQLMICRHCNQSKASSHILSRFRMVIRKKVWCKKQTSSRN